MGRISERVNPQSTPPEDAATGRFKGAKLAILTGGRVISLLRDDKPDIPFPGLWDLPGGGREGDETPEACVLRETREETGLLLGPQVLSWARLYGQAPHRVWFFVARLPGLDLSRLRLGDEGQRLQAMPIAEFLHREDVIWMFQHRLAQYLAEEPQSG